MADLVAMIHKYKGLFCGGIFVPAALDDSPSEIVFRESFFGAAATYWDRVYHAKELQ